MAADYTETVNLTYTQSVFVFADPEYFAVSAAVSSAEVTRIATADLDYSQYKLTGAELGGGTGSIRPSSGFLYPRGY